MEQIHQGDILRIDMINYPVMVVSKDLFNKTGEIIGCPVFSEGIDTALHISVTGIKTSGYVHCEKMKLLDLKARRFSKIDAVSMYTIMNITDAIQGLFDYI